MFRPAVMSHLYSVCGAWRFVSTDKIYRSVITSHSYNNLSVNILYERFLISYPEKDGEQDAKKGNSGHL
jgi:hypothetical protein